MIKSNTFYSCKLGKEQYKELEVANLSTAGFENKVREASQNKKRYLTELRENKKIERGLEENESVSIGCVNCTGTLLECMDIQESIPEIYPEVHHWVDSMSSQEELSQVCSSEYSSTLGVITRNKKKIKKNFIIKWTVS